MSTRTALVPTNGTVATAYESLTTKLSTKYLTEYQSTACAPKMHSVASAAPVNPARAGLSLVPKCENVQATSKDINLDAEHGVAAIKQDIEKGDKWSARSIETWKRLFDEAVAEPKATESSVFLQMNAFATAINRMTRVERVRIAASKGQNVASYYMMLSKDKAAVLSNNLSVAKGKESPTIIKLGTFGRTI